MSTYRSIKEWSDDDKPREKLLNKGREALSDAELIAILLGSGTRSKSAVDVARELLNGHSKDLNILARSGVNDLCSYDGIGPAKAVGIIAATELSSRRKMNHIVREKIASSTDVITYFQARLSDLNYEQMWVLLLNRANKIIKPVRVSEGGLAGTVVDPKRIFKTALDGMAASIILCHNHPSGNPQPSRADKVVTKKIAEGGKLMEIPLLDHVIIAGKQYFSFADEGLV